MYRQKRCGNVQENSLDVFKSRLLVRIESRAEDSAAHADVGAPPLDRFFEISRHAHAELQDLRLQAEARSNGIAARAKPVEAFHVAWGPDCHESFQLKRGAAVLEVAAQRQASIHVGVVYPRFRFLPAGVDLDEDPQRKLASRRLACRLLV